VVDDEALHGTAIVVTELVTNALVHSDEGGPVRLGLQVGDDALIVSVTDRSGTLPLP
jgi:anti-sigma regulatory factor (Ser/Thr protein kinase)